MENLHQSLKNQERKLPGRWDEAVCLSACDGYAPEEVQALNLDARAKLLSFLLDLLAAVSHEIRTPLSVIMIANATLQRRAERIPLQEQRELLQMIEQASTRLETLTNRMLHIAQIEMGVVSLDASPVQLLALAQEAMARAEQQVPEPLQGRFTFTVRCQDRAGNPLYDVPPVIADAACLSTILDQLLDNAIRFSPEGGCIQIIVQPGSSCPTGSPADTVKGSAELCVRDQGVGIPQEALDHLFEPFYRADTQRTHDVSGLGLGLTLCKELVRLHQGRIWAEQCPTGGSAFHVWLPS